MVTGSSAAIGADIPPTIVACFEKSTKLFLPVRREAAPSTPWRYRTSRCRIRQGIRHERCGLWRYNRRHFLSHSVREIRHIGVKNRERHDVPHLEVQGFVARPGLLVVGPFQDALVIL